MDFLSVHTTKPRGTGLRGFRVGWRLGLAQMLDHEIAVELEHPGDEIFRSLTGRLWLRPELVVRQTPGSYRSRASLVIGSVSGAYDITRCSQGA